MKREITLRNPRFYGLRIEVTDTQIVVYDENGNIEAFCSDGAPKYELAGIRAEQAFLNYCGTVSSMTRYEEVLRVGMAKALRAGFESLAASST